jgi:type III pantothenate kinase
MLLAVDVGNTHTVLGFYDGRTLVHTFRVESAKGRTSDETHVLVRSLLEIAGLERSRVHGSILASVVPALTEPIVRAIRAAFGHEMLVVGPGIKTGMPILIENPREVGADRIVNAVAAFERTKGAVVVVDLGTATTFDVISARGEYLGGAIAPGVQISADALFTRGAKLPRTEIVRPQKAVGRSTVQAMQSGIVFGYVGLVDGLVERLRAEVGPCAVVATGGLARLIAADSKTIEVVEDDLTLEGLRILHERNSG